VSPLLAQPVFVRNIQACINDENVVQVRGCWSGSC